MSCSSTWGATTWGGSASTGTVRVSELMVVETLFTTSCTLFQMSRGCCGRAGTRLTYSGSTFPAGTLSGAPKVRAMEIIEELEPVRREIYGGAVGYFSFSGNMDMAIAIRTLVVKDGKVHLQAGAGIVADSEPAAEYQETVNKARAVVKAIEMVEQGLE